MCSLAEIDRSQLATLSEFTSGAWKTLQLSSGGVAVLQVPSAELVDGKLLKIIVSGRVQFISELASINAQVALTSNGSTTVVPALAVSDGFNGDYSFAIEFNAIWDSVVGELFIGYRAHPAGGASPWTELGIVSSPTANPGIATGYAATNQSDIKVNLEVALTNVSGGAVSSSDAVIITQFKLGLA